MKNILFVGDQPSSKNIDPNVAFIGTMSHKVLNQWIEILKVNKATLENSYSQPCQDKIKLHYKRGDIVIALGNKASSVLDELKIEHFKLPHPSPRNRKLNNKDFIMKQLDLCTKYIVSKEESNE